MSTITDSLKADFDVNGFVSIPGFLNADGLAAIRSHLDRFIRDIVPGMPPAHAFFENPGDPASLKQLFHLADYDAFFKELTGGGPFRQLAETLLGEPVTKGEAEYFNKPAGAGKPTPPHQDAYYFMLAPPQAITFWIALEDVDLENGCLHYIPGSHLEGMRPHGRNPTLGFSQCITDFGTADDLAREIAIPVKAGDVLAHHGMTIHRAPGNHSADRSRKVIGLVYFGASAREDVVAKEAYQEKLRQERQSQTV